MVLYKISRIIISVSPTHCATLYSCTTIDVCIWYMVFRCKNHYYYLESVLRKLELLGSVPIFLVPVPLSCVTCKLEVTNESYIIVSHTEVGNVTKIEECDYN